MTLSGHFIFLLSEQVPRTHSALRHIPPRKVDVYQFGNILFVLLQEEYPFRGRTVEDAQELVKAGRRPDIYNDLWNSADPVNQALKEGMIWCHQQDLSERCSARELEEFFKRKMRELDPGQLEKWGLS